MQTRKVIAGLALTTALIIAGGSPAQADEIIANTALMTP
jgi:hypothetical protein